MHGPIEVDVNAPTPSTRVAIPLAGKGTDDASNAALQTLRNDVLPATVGTVPGATYAVTGARPPRRTRTRCSSTRRRSSSPSCSTFAFLLLLVSFRSIVIAVKAIVLNLLSVGAAYGVLVALFQYGWGENLLDFQLERRASRSGSRSSCS